jgi:hypothetical protein
VIIQTMESVTVYPSNWGTTSAKDYGLFRAGDHVRVNGDGDLRMDWDARPHVGCEAVIIKQCKSGLYQVRTMHGVISLPKRNLDAVS